MPETLWKGRLLYTSAFAPLQFLTSFGHLVLLQNR